MYTNDGGNAGATNTGDAGGGDGGSKGVLGLLDGNKQAPTGGDPNAKPSGNAGDGGGGGNAFTLPALPDNWRDALPEDLRDNATLKLFKDVPSMAKSLVNAQKMVGENKIAIPDPKFATPEDYRNVQKKLGLPEKAEDYKINVDKEAGLHEEFVKSFQEAAFNVGVLPQHAQALIDWYGKTSKEITGQIVNQSKETQLQEFEGLRREWGDKFEKNAMAAELGAQDLLDPAGAKWLNDTGLAKNPHILRMLKKAGEMLREDDLRSDAVKKQFGDAMEPKEAQKEIDKIHADLKHPYWDKSHPAHKAAVNEMAKYYGYANPTVDPLKK